MIKMRKEWFPTQSAAHSYNKVAKPLRPLTTKLLIPFAFFFWYVLQPHVHTIHKTMGFSFIPGDIFANQTNSFILRVWIIPSTIARNPTWPAKSGLRKMKNKTVQMMMNKWFKVVELSQYTTLEFMRQTKQSINEGTDCSTLKEAGQWKRPLSFLNDPFIKFWIIFILYSKN